MKLSITRCQVSREKRANLETAKGAYKKAHEAGADLLILPETFMSSVVNRSNAELWAEAEPVNGPFVKSLQDLSKTSRLWSVFGMLERPTVPDQKQRVYNTVVVLDHKGQIASTYRKTHLYDAFGTKESDVFLAGTALPEVIISPFGKMAVEVCYELRFPEISRRLARQGAELLVIPAAWYSGPNKAQQWTVLLQARALENTIFVAGANQGGTTFAGDSIIVDPLSTPLAHTNGDDDLVTVEIDLGQIEMVRQSLPCIHQIRNDLFLKDPSSIHGSSGT